MTPRQQSLPLPISLPAPAPRDFREAYADSELQVPFERALELPALAICLRNLATLRALRVRRAR